MRIAILLLVISGVFFTLGAISEAKSCINLPLYVNITSIQPFYYLNSTVRIDLNVYGTYGTTPEVIIQHIGYLELLNETLHLSSKGDCPYPACYDNNGCLDVDDNCTYSATYSNLPEGNYLIRISVMDCDDLEFARFAIFNAEEAKKYAILESIGQNNINSAHIFDGDDNQSGQNFIGAIKRYTLEYTNSRRISTYAYIGVYPSTREAQAAYIKKYINTKTIDKPPYPIKYAIEDLEGNNVYSIDHRYSDEYVWPSSNLIVKIQMQDKDIAAAYLKKLPSDLGNDCIGLGEEVPDPSLWQNVSKINMFCCAGLTGTLTKSAYGSNCQPIDGSGKLCLKCGDGLCDSNYEDNCNCPKDCMASGNLEEWQGLLDWVYQLYFKIWYLLSGG